MPIYEYQCNKCHHDFEVIQKINDDPVSSCPKCASKKIQKLVSPAGFQLKGTGWYVTDFKNNDRPKPPASTNSNVKKSDKSKTQEVQKSASKEGKIEQ